MSGSVYSVSERFATAMLVDTGVVAWIGSDAGAQVHRDEVDRIVDLGGDLVAPAFVDLGRPEPRLREGFAYASTDAPVADRWTDEQYSHADGPLGVVPRDPCRLRRRNVGLCWRNLEGVKNPADSVSRCHSRTQG